LIEGTSSRVLVKEFELRKQASMASLLSVRLNY